MPAVEASVDSWGPLAWARVRRHLEAFAPDVVHIQYQTGAFDMRLGVNLLPWLARTRRPRPVLVVTFHDLKEPYVLPKLGRARHLATMALAAGADAVVVTNHEDFARLRSRADACRTRPVWGNRPLAAIPIGSNIPPVPADFDRSAARRSLGFGPNDFVIAHFGFLVPSKGLETLVEAFERLFEDQPKGEELGRGRPLCLPRGRVEAALPQHNTPSDGSPPYPGADTGVCPYPIPPPSVDPQTKLLMVGATGGDSGWDGQAYANEIRRRLSALPPEGVIWTGALEAKGVAQALAAADVAALPYRAGASLRHGTLLAALAQGLPIVTTLPGEQPAPLPVLRDGENALLVPPENPAALAAALERVASNADLRARLAEGSARVARAATWEGIAAQTLSLYRQTLARVL